MNANKIMVKAIKLYSSTTDSTCYVFTDGNKLKHAHENPNGTWNKGDLNLSTLEHHMTMYQKERFFTTKTDIPEGVVEIMEEENE